MMGPWSYLFLVSGSMLLISFLVQRKLNEIPELATSVDHEYDYIIVGGGSSGCVLANRLSESGAAKVLLLEAGPDDRDNHLFSVPVHSISSSPSDYEWGYSTVPQKNGFSAFKEKKLPWKVAKVLGGASNLNSMFYIRGLQPDYDNWAKNGAQNWSYAEILPYFLKSEDNENAEFVKTGYHKMGGLLKVARSKTHSLSNFLVRAGKEMGYKIVDINGGGVEGGVVEVQSTLRRGVRQSISKVFLYPALHRSNLHVMTEATVTKIIMIGKKASGVQFERNGIKHVVKAKAEVVLSAGTVGSAKLLLLSGIGPKEHLEDLKIPVVSDLPVGGNLQDGLRMDFPVGIKEDISITIEKVSSLWENFKYTAIGKGVLASPAGTEVLTYIHSSLNSDVKWPDLRLQFQGLLHQPHMEQRTGFSKQALTELSGRQRFTEGMICFSTLLRPKSRGRLTLLSSDPSDSPLIDPNYLEDSSDVHILLDGIKFCKKILESKSMKEIGATYADLPSPSCAKFTFDSDDYWRCLIRARSQSQNEPVGTCKMGASSDKSAVVDPSLRVKGVDNLRVVDSSIMPFSPSGGTAIPEVMIAEKAADLIQYSS